ncbi:hypothetical protein FPE01S_05_00770 [Flavihumibacter petaseus NBRC 106054]|uniref:Uncharacterized protein n=1 Tax=Flavihumibacter petaseus NBRC 106054 TaxID=1220578 RepID=A0A0E9N7R0_9BACT|nr:hypothetical protein FPE01S_05_00770 [Flavihumibacter petaseus NBRC 106054]
MSEAWVIELELFLGMRKDETLKYFCGETIINTLFGEEPITYKKDQAIEKSAKTLISVINNNRWPNQKNGPK